MRLPYPILPWTLIKYSCLWENRKDGCFQCHAKFYDPANKYMRKVNTSKRREICSKLTMKAILPYWKYFHILAKVLKTITLITEIVTIADLQRQLSVKTLKGFISSFSWIDAHAVSFHNQRASLCSCKYTCRSRKTILIKRFWMTNQN